MRYGLLKSYIKSSLFDNELIIRYCGARLGTDLPGMTRITDEMDKLKLFEEGYSFGLKEFAKKIIAGEYAKKNDDRA